MRLRLKSIQRRLHFNTKLQTKTRLILYEETKHILSRLVHMGWIDQWEGQTWIRPSPEKKLLRFAHTFNELTEFIIQLLEVLILKHLKFGDGDGPNLCTVKK